MTGLQHLDSTPELAGPEQVTVCRIRWPESLRMTERPIEPDPAPAWFMSCGGQGRLGAVRDENAAKATG